MSLLDYFTKRPRTEADAAADLARFEKLAEQGRERDRIRKLE
jgi:hypothetical protein